MPELSSRTPRGGGNVLDPHGPLSSLSHPRLPGTAPPLWLGRWTSGGVPLVNPNGVTGIEWMSIFDCHIAPQAPFILFFTYIFITF